MQITLATKEGPCKTNVFSPAAFVGTGKFPAVIFAIDGVGPRASLDAMAQRIADAGYVVAIPDLFHRAGDVLDLVPPGTAREAKSIFPLLRDPAVRALWLPRFFASATNEDNLRADIGATLDYLATRSDVRTGPAAVTGYCMGGQCALRIATIFGDRFAAVASFHGGFLATEAPDSPHHKVAQIGKSTRVYIGAATEDPSFTPEMRARLIAAFDTAHTHYTIETYAAAHGWCVPDSPSFNAAEAERHYAALTALLREAFA